MQDVFDAFDERVREVDRFFDFLSQLEEPGVQLYFPSKRTHRFKVPDSECVKTLKASAFLLIYNLVESSIRDGIGAIYVKAASDGCTMDTLDEKLRRLWIDQCFKDVEKESASLQTFRQKSHEIVEIALKKAVAGLEKEQLPISGNLDANVIRGLCKKHGVSGRTHRRALGGGELETVRKKRNSLAHGNESFEECGRDYTVQNLRTIKRQTEIFVRSILRNIEKYITAKSYRR
jgi:hypothetical protein